ncbi:MAG: pectin acetylesterase-family hydrolase [Myxococcales bacterium]
MRFLPWLVGLASVAACSSSDPAAEASELDAGDTHDASPHADGAAGHDADGADADMPEFDPLDTPLDQWTFLPIAGATCANGTATGVGVNRSSDTDNLVIMLEGGGACWDQDTCFVRKSAVHIEDTYDAALFDSDFASKQPATKRDPNNPVSLGTQILVPYCTGDLHAGTVSRAYGSKSVHHVGGLNIDAILARLRQGVQAPKTVWLLGSSAGGYGATLNLQKVERAFPEAQVHMLADSAPLLTPAGGLWSTWQSAWNLQLPDTCGDCTERFGGVIDAIAEDDRHGRIGLLAYQQDAVIGLFFGFDGPSEQTKISELLTQSYGHADTRFFIANGTSHVMLASPGTQSAQAKTVLQDWLVGWILGPPLWLNAP